MSEELTRNQDTTEEQQEESEKKKRGVARHNQATRLLARPDNNPNAAPSTAGSTRTGEPDALDRG
jgi:hypothetical protein